MKLQPPFESSHDSRIYALMEIHSQCLKQLHTASGRYDWQCTRQRFKIRKVLREIEEVMITLVPQAFEKETFITYGKKYIRTTK